MTEDSKSGKPADGGNLSLAYASPVRHAVPATEATAALDGLLGVYDQLIAVLRESYDEGLDNYTDGLVGVVVRCRARLESGVDDEAAEEMNKELRAGLHEFPRVLRSLLPGLGPRLGESIESKLGIQFSSY